MKKKSKLQKKQLVLEENQQISIEKHHNFLLDFVETWKNCDYLEAFTEKNKEKSIDELVIYIYKTLVFLKL